MIGYTNTFKLLQLIGLLLPASFPVAAFSQTGTGASLEHVDRMTPRQLSDRADTSIEEMRQMLERVLRILEEARSEKDVVKLNCVNEHLTHLRGLVRVSEEGLVLMREALSRQEMDEARHEFTKLMVARDRVQQLRVAAEECVGQLAFVVDEELHVEVDVPEDLPDAITETGPMHPVVVRPPKASRVE